MKVALYSGVTFLVAATLFTGCAGTKSQVQPEPTQAAYISQQVEPNCIDQKTKNFLLMLDASDSMEERVNGQSKYDIADKLVKRVSQSIPGGMNLNVVVRTFGAGSGSDMTTTIGPRAFAREIPEASLGEVNYGGHAPTGTALIAGGEEAASMSGQTAVILVSDGKESLKMAAYRAAQDVKKRLGDKICFYTILVGTDPNGKALLGDIVKIGQCGFATTADAVYVDQGINNFVSAVLCSGRTAPVLEAIGDTDDDGVADNLDQCPKTLKGATVNVQGCWAYSGDVLFDFDIAEPKPIAFPILEEAVSVLNHNLDIYIELQGYTDSTGAEAYNLKLSQRRAESVKRFLVSRGIDPVRLSAKGYGPSNPVASNDIPEGRAKNRRVEFRIL